MDEINEIRTIEEQPIETDKNDLVVSKDIEEINFSLKDCIFAWIAFFAGYLVCRAIPVVDNPFGGFLFITALFVVTAVVLIMKGFKLNFSSVLSGSMAIILSMSLALWGDRVLGSWSFFFSAVLYTFFVYSLTGNSLDGIGSNFLACDFFKALIILPFRSFGDVFRAAFSNKSNGGLKAVGKIVLGVAIAIIPTAIVIVLLSYDSDFSELITKIFKFDIGSIISHIGSVIAGVPIGMYIFGLFSSSINKKCESTVTKEGIESAGVACRFAPVITVLAATLPILFVYCVFFMSQLKYYISGFTGILPEEFSYAEYAKEGFFQLCAVSAINLVIIIATSLFIKRKTKKSPVALKLISCCFTVATLVLISTAIAKMVMYIETYGLTRKRVFSSVFMIALAFVFIFIAIKQFAFKFKVVPLSLAVCTVLFGTLALSNVNGIIVEYNVNRYLDGTLSTVDINATEELGYSAVEKLAELAEWMDDKYNGDIVFNRKIKADKETTELYDSLRSRLKRAAGQLNRDDDQLFKLSLSEVRARVALRELGFDC